MKKLFKKAVTVLGSLAMVGATIATSAAAAYPNPFGSDSAVVIGSQLDSVAAMQVVSNLGIKALTDSTSTVTGDGDVYKLEKSSNPLNLGDSFRSVLSEGKLDDKDMPTLLADGKFEDSADAEYDYTQKIYLADETFQLIYDKDYKDKTPTLGTYIAKDGPVLTYNISYTDKLNVSTMPTKDLKIGGKDYYVLTATATQFELLDTAQSFTINDGESMTVEVDGVSYDVSVLIYESGAVFEVNGETSDQLASGGYDKLTDDVYVVAKSVRYSSKETTTSSVEFSLGQGKIVLKNGEEVKVNGEAVDKLYVDITDSTGITDLAFRWNADEEIFLTGEEGYNEIVMPFFGSVKVLYNGFDFVEEPEETEFVSSDSYISVEAPILDGKLSLPFLNRSSSSASSNFTGLGIDAESVLKVPTDVATSSATYNISVNESEETSFVVTYIKGTDGYTYAFQLDSVTESDGKPVLKLDNLAGGDDVELTDISDYVDLDDITLTLVGNQTDENATIKVSTAVSGASVRSNNIVTEDGMTIWLPSTASGNGTAVPVYNLTSMDVTMTEENRDGDIAAGANFTVTVDSTDADGVHISATSIDEQKESDDFYVGYKMSDLGTKIEFDKSGSTNAFVVKYNGEEVTADVQILSADAVVSSTSTGAQTVLDTETSAYADKNIVVVGGSCINDVAAELLGGAYCGEDFTAATGVGAGQFMFKAYEYGEKVALLVAGYEQEDTAKAVTYLLGDEEVSTDPSAEIVIKETSQVETVA